MTRRYFFRSLIELENCGNCGGLLVSGCVYSHAFLDLKALLKKGIDPFLWQLYLFAQLSVMLFEFVAVSVTPTIVCAYIHQSKGPVHR